MTMHKIHFKALDYSLEFDESEFNAEVNNYFYEYGVRQCLADSYASAKSGSERREMFDKRLAALFAGELRTARESDPLARQVTSIATMLANKYFKSKGIKATEIPAADWKAKMAELREREDVIAAAQKAVDAMAELEL